MKETTDTNTAALSFLQRERQQQLDARGQRPLDALHGVRAPGLERRPLLGPLAEVDGAQHDNERHANARRSHTNNQTDVAARLNLVVSTSRTGHAAADRERHVARLEDGVGDLRAAEVAAHDAAGLSDAVLEVRVLGPVVHLALGNGNRDGHLDLERRARARHGQKRSGHGVLASGDGNGELAPLEQLDDRHACEPHVRNLAVAVERLHGLVQLVALGVNEDDSDRQRRAGDGLHARPVDTIRNVGGVLDGNINPGILAQHGGRASRRVRQARAGELLDGRQCRGSNPENIRLGGIGRQHLHLNRYANRHGLLGYTDGVVVLGERLAGGHGHEGGVRRNTNSASIGANRGAGFGRARDDDLALLPTV
eukprot:m.867358 g.867358  ORF g.867358 m.867358 type:complete len:367 (-) comp59728_c0_seq2:3023-4123(-)